MSALKTNEKNNVKIIKTAPKLKIYPIKKIIKISREKLLKYSECLGKTKESSCLLKNHPVKTGKASFF
jgi:hypothetical protein